MKRFGFLLILIACNLSAQSQPAENLVIITSDGIRWQEIFRGMEKEIAHQKKFNQNDSLYIFNKFWSEKEEDRRKKLMPFLWNVLSTEGQIFGNRDLKNKMNTVNKSWLSFPGYSELLTGYTDPEINSNNFIFNKNKNVLEFINEQKGFNQKVAVFASWYALSGVLNKEDANYPIVSAFDTLNGSQFPGNQTFINNLLKDSYRPWGNGECLDVFTHYRAFDYLKNAKPRVLYIAYGETDEWAHSGLYKNYLDAIHQFDAWLQDIWNYLQSDPQYKNKTTLIITTDHGRGYGNRWTAHEREVRGSDEIWMAAIGKGILPKDEISTHTQLYQNQIAATVANLLGLNFSADHPIAEKIDFN